MVVASLLVVVLAWWLGGVTRAPLPSSIESNRVKVTFGPDQREVRLVADLFLGPEEGSVLIGHCLPCALDWHYHDLVLPEGVELVERPDELDFGETYSIFADDSSYARVQQALVLSVQGDLDTTVAGEVSLTVTDDSYLANAPVGPFPRYSLLRLHVSGSVS